MLRHLHTPDTGMWAPHSTRLETWTKEYDMCATKRCVGQRGCFVEPRHRIKSSKWAILISRTGDMGCTGSRTAERWSWNSKSAKECVTTHLPNQLAPKMDGAYARNLHPTGPTVGRAPHVAWCSVRSRWLLKIRRTKCFPRPIILITASGLQGEQPLVDGIM
ncbi:hypothetical protein H5410_014702 [Solanum commersonii]|uniref:Uncharacterized protein n=1 Tax=Solanum commersonii TaxID=4109 RepID=A0A9J5ZRP4_SOLCO|nr:hypothetical protein H5410_014702 [Solanum commersonii]